MKLKFDAAVVILYHPTKSAIDNIGTYIDSVKTLFIVDNSIREHTHLERLENYSHVKILHSGSNVGIAQGLNIALDKAYSEGLSWLMTFDQDTSFKEGDMDRFIKNFKTIDNKNVAIISPLHNAKLIQYNQENTYVDKEYVMTSANLVNVPIAKQLGGYDENLFIDDVDHEFCFRLKEKGYRVLQDTSVAVNHVLGTPHKYRSKVKLYEASRLYYMVRNYFYLKDLYRTKQTLFFKKRDKYLLKFFLRQILYGKHRIQNIKFLFKGIMDYKKQKFGKLDHESY